MARPNSYPRWSTNSIYPAGTGKDWSGQTTKVQPSAGKQAQGLEPNTDQPAEEINWLYNLQDQWIEWFLTLPTTASDLPQYVYQDAAGNTRFVVDHNGYPMGGRISQFREEWAYSTQPGAGTGIAWSGTPWTTDIATGGSIANTVPSASYNARYLTLTPPTTLSFSSVIWGPVLFLANTPGMTAVMEFEFGMNAAAAGTASKTSYWVGLQDGNDDPSTNQNVITLYKGYNQANWQTITLAAGTPHTTALSVPMAPTAGAFPTDRMRIELQGSASPYGAYQARFFVSDTLVATVAAGSLPGAVTLRPVFSAYTENGSPVGSRA
jgi:hypothetical protein